MNKIYVTKTSLPPLEEYEKYIRGIWESSYLTNQGPLLEEFENNIENKFRVNSFHFVTNGTLALQIALRSLDITDCEVITTPFSYVATSSALLLERCKPVYVDIDPETYCINTSKIEGAITKNTKAILAVHVFGIPCDIESIDKIAKKHNLKVIYDAAHAFGVSLGGESIFKYGDISVTSFHATKLFHTIEGGGLFVNDQNIDKKVELTKRFGHDGDTHYMLGMNAKASEFQAAMGLCNLKYVDRNIIKRKKIFSLYDKYLAKGLFTKPKIVDGITYNYSYYPVVFEDENKLLEAFERLNKENIFPRRYFFPSLNQLPYVHHEDSCPVSEDISSRIACLPLYPELTEAEIIKICSLLNFEKQNKS